MGNDISLVNTGKFAKPVNTLIEKTSNAIGILYEPRRIRKEALAEADAAKTKALSNLEIAGIEKRALTRLVTEEIKKQENIETIMEKSFENIKEDAKPENIEDDWISNFFDKCKLISDNEMQTLWSKILAGESNQPGSYSKRTIEFMSTMDKDDAILFSNLCKFCWIIDDIQPLILNCNHSIYNESKINFINLLHLDNIGLINFDSVNGFSFNYTNKKPTINYFDREVNLNFTDKNDCKLQVGVVLFTQIGKDLAKAIQENTHTINEEYYKYILENLRKQNIILSE